MIYATDARRAILAALRAEPRYASARDVAARLRTGKPAIALSTVYRTLELLCELGLVSRRAGDRRIEYLYCGDEHHHHAICARCGRVENVACTAMWEVRRELRERSGFVLDDHEMTLYGTCAACAEASGR